MSGFAESGVAEDEGQHLQTVFPPAYEYGGPGRFAFDLRSHLTEKSALNTADSRDRLLREWGAYYDLSKKVLVEKSPPNIVRSRFFQALFPCARFLFVVRHPIPVALASQKLANASIIQLLLHWHVAHSIMLRDLRHIKAFRLIRYEEFIESPHASLDEIRKLIDVDEFTPQEKIADHNARYFSRWRQEYSRYGDLIAEVIPSMQSPMEVFGYSFSEPFVGPCQSVRVSP